MIDKSYRNRSSVISHIGQIRLNHEDNFLIEGDFIFQELQQQIKAEGNPMSCTYRSQNYENKAIYAISDGMGGHNGGEVASFIAMRKLSECRSHILAASTIEETVHRCQQYIDDANTEIVTKSYVEESSTSMGATLSTLIIHQGQAVGIYLGDSRIYHYYPDQLTRMTKDHTEGQRMLDLNLLTENEVERFNSRKDLTRYLGIDDQNLIMTGEVTPVVQINQRTWFLLCSDGLTDILNDEHIHHILTKHFINREVESAVGELVHHALEGTHDIRGGTDNITVMIVEVIPE